MQTPSLWEITIRKAETEKTGIFLIVPIKINGLKIPAVVDTAAEGTILSNEAFKLLRKKASDLRRSPIKGSEWASSYNWEACKGGFRYRIPDL